MEKVLHGILHKICLVYFWILFSVKPLRECWKIYERIFLRLRGGPILKLTPKNVLCLVEKLNLDYIISEKGIAIDPEKTSTLESWPVPKNARRCEVS